MRRLSTLLVATRRQAPADAAAASHALLVRAGMLQQAGAGLFVVAPLLLRVTRRIEAIIRAELDRVGCQELRFTHLQPPGPWRATGRWEALTRSDPIMLRTRDRAGAELGLGPTHEEQAALFAAERVSSHRQLPHVVYQIATKFRDEPRPRSGLLRTREFTMCDAYSLDVDEAAAIGTYERLAAAYERIFARCGLDVLRADADVGAMGGLPGDVRIIGDHAIADLHGFVCGANADGAHLRDVWWGRAPDLPELADPDRVTAGDPAPDGGTFAIESAIEAGHIFLLGTRYAEALGLTAAGPDGVERPVCMGSYGIGVERLAAALVEQHHDEAGIVWPLAVAPHSAVVVTVRAGDAAQERLAEQVTRSLLAADVDAVWDDRDARAGVKFTDAELIGFPWRLTVGREAAAGRVELTERAGGVTETADADVAVRRVAAAAAGAQVPQLR